MQKRLVVGLGNPGSEYVATRHNIGAWAVENFAKENGFEFTKKKLFLSHLAKKDLDDKIVFLQLPFTYMNESGKAVFAAVKNLGIALDSVLVVVDDVYLPLGSMRMRPSGSSGGHNGLKSIEEALGSQAYFRLRIGVGIKENLVEHVLGKFTEEERIQLENTKGDVLEAIKSWVLQVNKKKIAGD